MTPRRPWVRFGALRPNAGIWPNEETSLARLGFWLLTALVIGCGSAEPEGSGAIEPSLSEIEARIFARSCTFTACHGATTPREGLSLLAPAHDQLVGQPSTQVPSRVRVKPGDPEGSYLMEKITSAQPAKGVRMPQGQPALEPAAVTAIRLWIQNGASSD